MNIAAAKRDRFDFVPQDDTISRNRQGELGEISALAQRFRQAHVQLNDIELQLHDSFTPANRLTLLGRLEEARMEYSDARFALSTRNEISGGR